MGGEMPHEGNRRAKNARNWFGGGCRLRGAARRPAIGKNSCLLSRDGMGPGRPLPAMSDGQDGEKGIYRLLLYIPLEEFIGSQHLVDALAVVAAAGELMSGSGMADIFHRSAKDFKAAVEHFALDEAGAAIALAVEDDQGGGD